MEFGNPDRAPLLLILGASDRTVPAPTVRSTYRRQSRSPVATELKAYPNRSHFHIAEPGWEAVADDAIAWVEAQDGTQVPGLPAARPTAARPQQDGF